MRWPVRRSPTIQPPTLLRNILRTHEDLRLLEPSVDLPGGYSVDEIRDFGYWPPWVVADLDRDHRADIAAVVVAGAAAQRRFGVIAVHAARPAAVQWVVPLDAAKLNGIAINHPAADSLTPLYCIECDSNPWFRWNGQAYELELYAIGDVVSIAPSLPGESAGMFSAPNPNSTIRKVEPCTKGRVLSRRGTSYETRWYLVEARAPRSRGWVPATSLSEDDCIG